MVCDRVGVPIALVFVGLVVGRDDADDADDVDADDADDDDANDDVLFCFSPRHDAGLSSAVPAGAPVARRP